MEGIQGLLKVRKKSDDAWRPKKGTPLGYVKWYYERNREEAKGLPKAKKDDYRKLFGSVLAGYERNRELSPIYHFCPNLPQGKLIYSLNKDGQMPRTILLEGSNKPGKSTLGVAWQISMGCGGFPWLDPKKKYEILDVASIWHFDLHKNAITYRKFLEEWGFESYDELSEKFFDIKKLCPKLKVPNVNLAVGETYTESVDKDLLPKYLGKDGMPGLIPKSWGPKPKKNQQGVINKITLTAGPGKGSEFHFRSYKSTSDEFEGIDVSGSILYNEPPPQDIVTAVNRGALPYDTRVMIAYTALKEPWIYRDYVNRASRWYV